MKRATILTILLAASCIFAEDFNLLKNSGFEQKSPHWNYGNIELADGGVNQSKKVLLKTDTPSAPNGFRGALYEEIRKPEGGKYILSGYVRPENLYAVYLNAIPSPDTGKKVSRFLVTARLEKSEHPGWLRFILPLNLPENQSSVKIIIQVFSQTRNAVISLDNITMIHQKD